MNSPKIIVTMKYIQRFKVLQDVTEKRLTGLKAATILGITNVHVSRLKKRLLNSGIEGILRKPPPLPPNRQITNEQLAQIIKLCREIYFDLNINHFKEKLNEKHNLPYSYSTIRNSDLNVVHF